MENKIIVQLLNAKKLDFKTDNGDLIKGLKLYYYDNNVKEGSIKGDIIETFLSADKVPNFEEIYNMLKDHFVSCEKSGIAPSIILYYTIKSINSKPVITKIDLKK